MLAGVELPAQAKELAKQGNLIAAIKLTRESSRCGLKEAKEAVEAYLSSGASASGVAAQHARSATSDLPLHAILSLEKGRLIDAIKQTREATGLGLKATKDRVDDYLEHNPRIQARFKAAASATRKRLLGQLSTVLFLLALAVAVYVWMQGIDG